ncbi:MAG: envelope biogenesis factor ElyC [Deltaproteobacteria bacterium]|nr:envelope biogenesis factor ElyC [Deltaproteobacteria bacterium]
MLVVKKVIGPLFFPISLCLEVLLAGWLLISFTKFQRSGKILMLFGMIMLGLFSYAPFADRLLEPLEYRYPVLSPEAVSGCTNGSDPASPKWIVVLGGGHSANPELHPLSQLSHPSLARLAEGIRLYREIPGGKLLLMGGAMFSDVPESVVMSRAARCLGVDEKDIVVERRSKDTRDQAEAARTIIGENRFFLVTSASHMPRSMALFKKSGTDPIPAPTGHLVKKEQHWDPDRFVLQARNLLKSERAFYEFLGMGWAWFRGHV